MLRNRVLTLMEMMALSNVKCPAHSSCSHVPSNTIWDTEKPDYAFEMACSNIRFGEGVTQEVGWDVKLSGAKNVVVFTDPNLVNGPIVNTVLRSIDARGIKPQIFDQVRVEPTDKSLKKAIDFVREHRFDAFVAVGGGSVMDTAKAANLYQEHPEAEFLDFVNAPLGGGLPPTNKLKPLFAVPTTAGTGSETTGVAVFDLEDINAKTGIAHRSLRPTLGIVDPLNTLSMPRSVATFSGFDVLCHALESFTALPYNRRKPRPLNPLYRPAYQGSNPISDVWARHALSICNKYMFRSVESAEDVEARSQMHLASCLAAIGFGNAGVHLCHGLSYAIAGQVRDYHPKGYDDKHPIIPHGLSVVITSPAVFRYTSTSCPERHLQAAGLLGTDVTNLKIEDGGKILSDTLLRYMDKLQVPNGIKALGYTSADIDSLVKSSLPQERVLRLAPGGMSSAEDLASIFENSLDIYK